MHLKNILFTLLLSMIGLSVFGQQRYFDERVVYRQHFMFPVLVNPGAAGINDYQQLILDYRNDYSGFELSPKTITLNYNGNLGNRLGFGALIFSDTYGYLGTFKSGLTFSYNIESPTNKVGFGIAAEYIQHQVRGAALNNSQIDPDDASFLNRLDGNQFFDATFGIYGIYDGRLKYGISLPSLITTKLNSEDGPAGDRMLGYIGHLAYVTTTNDGDITIEPSVFVKSLNNIPTHVDFNVKASFLEDRFVGALGYTFGASQGLGFLVGTKVDNMQFNYSYNISTREFQDFNNGSHELTLGYIFNKKDSKVMEKKEMEENTEGM